MANYNIVVTKGVDKQPVVDLFDTITDPLVGSSRVFTVEIADEDVESYKANPGIALIEVVNNEISED
tara:strand:- start:300 stop:500 length:201 start_codon:yes stop_codon:yes gene_type:complete